MDPFEARLERLEQSFSSFHTQAEKASALSAFLSNEYKDDFMNLPIAHLSGNTSNAPAFAERDAECLKDAHALFHFLGRHSISPTSLLNLVNPTQFSDPPIRSRLPCAYHKVESRVFCANDGILSCSACRLVRYCSKECQKRDWEKHKQDCRNRMRSDSWRPLWEEQCREPAFVSESYSSLSSFGGGVILWGNIPAINILGDVTEGESVKARDFRLAFIASGDLRNMIKTVNALPDDYNGKLAIVLNDRNPLVVARNVLILSAIGLMEDVDQAVDFALHLWYSAFIPMKGSALAFASLHQQLLADQPFDGRQINLSPTSTLSMVLSPLTIEAIVSDLNFNVVDAGTANNILNAVMNAPERVDYRDRFYARLKPSHRVAIQEYRRFGLLMPFGAPNAHLNRPNPSLITPTGQLWLNDSASPLEGWDICEVLRSGKEHGTTEEDIMGCLYFHVQDQLTTFARRLRKFSISFSMYDRDAIDLAGSLPPHLRRLDRIEVSNIMDREYAGVTSVLTKWGPMLDNEQVDSTLIGSFINWAYRTPGARASSNVRLVASCMDSLLRVRPVSLASSNTP
ncbi:hypothetical protein Moror_2823 [Moniliophthora roreri MCA 2997]|uniref:MYND-type domain-containing protein n=1 Tax=Moniliophthora roreri (strain MCA 2997) TaxID=1381753 RepID=V2YHY7_MONRO|nr:hypothetical protein Moror_2823 [Moniliophthora roreri MCA 2997]